MQYAKIKDNQIERIASIEALYPNTSFPNDGISDAWLTEQSLMKVIESEQYDSTTHKFEYVTPYIDNGIIKTYAITELSVEDKNIIQQARLTNQWVIMRELRNQKLSECDWTQVADVSNTTKQLWLEYRQALRDITTQTDPYNLIWPVKP